MRKPRPVELRERVVAFVGEDHGHLEEARPYPVVPRLVNDMIKLRRETEGLARHPMLNSGRAPNT